MNDSSAPLDESIAPNPVESPALAAAQVHSKVGAGAIGGSVAVVLLWAIGLTGVTIPLEVGGAITGLIGFAFGYIAKS